MKTKYILPAILALGTTVASTQAIATGLTYDPYENYYSEFYGIGVVPVATEENAQEASTFTDPYAEYYNTYYSLDTLLDESKKVETTDNYDMADPLNYYNW